MKSHCARSLSGSLFMFACTVLTFASWVALPGCSGSGSAPGTRVFVIERDTGSVAVIDYRTQKFVKRIRVGGDLKHASMVFEPGLRYGFIATRSGDLLRLDVQRLVAAGSVATSKNSIGLAISQDGRTIAVSEYSPGGITLVDTETFRVVQRIEARTQMGGREIVSRVTGMVDGPENRFLCALMDAREIWELSPESKPATTAGATADRYRVSRRFLTERPHPFDALTTPEGRYYLTGHMRSDRVSLVDFWASRPVARTISTGRSSDRTPVKMPHMEAWASAGGKLFVPLPGERKLTVLSGSDFRQTGFVSLVGDPVYAVVRPDHREIWVTFSGAEDGKVQIIDTLSERTKAILPVGKKIYHLVFTPRGDRAIMSSNETGEVVILDALSYATLARIPVQSPSGIFGIWRAFETGL